MCNYRISIFKEKKGDLEALINHVIERLEEAKTIKDLNKIKSLFISMVNIRVLVNYKEVPLN